MDRRVRRFRSWPPPWARGQRIRAEAGRRRRQGRDRLVEEARFEKPPDEVAAAQPAGRPGGLPARKDDLAAGLPQLLRQLAARLPAPDDQDRPRRQAGFVAEPLDVDLEEAGRQRVGAGRAVGALEGSRAQDDAGSLHVAGRCPGDEAPRGAIDRPDGDALADGRRRISRVPHEMGNDLVAGHETVGIVARVGPARELHGPVRGHQAEAVPPIPPGLADPAALQDDVADPKAGELVADREAGGPAPDDQDICMLHGRRV
jgi:hypothetical protein